MDIKSKDIILSSRGLEPGGKVQKFIDSEMIKVMNPYTPMQSSTLINSVTLNTVIGSGLIEYGTPYDRYHYYGKLMVSPTTGSSYAQKGEKKVLTDKDMNYNGAPKRGPFWFVRAKADKKEKILEGARKIAGAE